MRGWILAIAWLWTTSGFGAEDFEGAKAFLKKHCLKCHGAKKPAAKLMLHKLTAEFGPAEKRVWEAVAAQLQSGAMPPKGQTSPDSNERDRVVSWIRSQLRRRDAGQRGLPRLPSEGNQVDHALLFGAKREGKTAATPVRIWRVRPSIYESFIEHATRKPFHNRFGRRAKLLSTPWGLTGNGIKDYSALHTIGEAETELLISNAQRVASMMTQKRGRHGRESRVFRSFARATNEPSLEECQSLIREGFQQILRRKPTADELKRHAGFLQKNVKQFGRAKGMETSLAAILLHPQAMFRFELGRGIPDANGRVKLSPVEVAYAVAYSLTDKSPDQKLSQAARDGKLGTKQEIAAHIDRLLKDESVAKPNILRFFREYFGYTAAPRVFKDQATRRKARLQGVYSPEDLVEDTDNLVLWILKRDRNVLRELLTTDRVFVSSGPRFRYWKSNREMLRKRAVRQNNPHTNSPFADKRNKLYLHYNFDPANWKETMPLKIPRAQRAGILTQPSWLIAHSTNFDNHAIHRGKWIQERLLGGVIPETPITVDAQLPDGAHLTLREKMRVTKKSVCWKCHRMMDPLGLPFEMFDHFGRYRTRELGKPVDATGKIAGSDHPQSDGDVSNAVAMMHRLAKSRRVQQVFLRHAFRFFLGRNETPEDAPILVAVEAAYIKSGGSFRAVIRELLTSDSFLYRKPPAERPARENLK